MTYKGILKDGVILVNKEIINTGGTIKYQSGDLTIYQQYHPFWLIPKTDKSTESYRWTFLNFSKDDTIL